MLPVAVAAITPENLYRTHHREFYKRCLLKFYRSQLERIQTLKIHIAQMPGESKETCRMSFQFTRQTAVTAIRGIRQALVFYDAGHVKSGMELLERRLEQIREAEKGLTDLFVAIKLYNELDRSRSMFESRPAQ